MLAERGRRVGRTLARGSRLRFANRFRTVTIGRLMLSAGQNLKTVRWIGNLARLGVVGSFFVMWKQFEIPAIEALKYSFSAGAIVHALMRVLVPVARVLDAARGRAMIVVVASRSFSRRSRCRRFGKGSMVPFWRSLTICGVIYFALDRLWRMLDARAMQRVNAIPPTEPV
jgi:hypothetical protein